MSAPRQSALTSRPNSHPCVPDPYLTEEHLALIFDEFNADILRFAARGTVFNNLVHNIRSVYMSQILLQQEDLAERSAQYELQLIEERERQLSEFRVQRDQLTADHEHRLAELIENYNRQVAQATPESAQPIPESVQPIPESVQQISESAQRISNREQELFAPRGWITNIEVRYDFEGFDGQCDRITELNRKSIDINAGLGGSFVWLVPKYCTEPASAMTRIEIDIQADWDGRLDLAKGAGGQYRYLAPQYHEGSRMIHTVNLLRLAQQIARLPPGFDGHSGNINAGRGRDFLYLIWKSESV